MIVTHNLKNEYLRCNEEMNYQKKLLKLIIIYGKVKLIRLRKIRLLKK